VVKQNSPVGATVVIALKTDLVHSTGAYVFHHNDGAIRNIIPDMTEAGIDVLNLIQWPCKGMELDGLKKRFWR